MPHKVSHGGDESNELLGEERVRAIDWSHPMLARLSLPARLIYSSLIDGCSEEACDTIAGVDLVWRNRVAQQTTAALLPTSSTVGGVLDTIVAAVDELRDSGLLLLVDEDSITGGWVRRPWEGAPS